MFRNASFLFCVALASAAPATAELGVGVFAGPNIARLAAPDLQAGIDLSHRTSFAAGGLLSWSPRAGWTLELQPMFVRRGATARDSRFRNSSEAVELAERACRLTGYSNPNYLDTLAAAYAEAGQTAKAVQIGEQAVQLAHSTRQPELARTIEERMKFYRAGHAYRE